MVKGERGVIDITLGNQIVVRVGNDTESGINLRSGTRVALNLAAEMLRKTADKMDEEARSIC